MGLMFRSDPPRPESFQAVMDALRAGIVVRMLTGDHVSYNFCHPMLLTK
jgi:magnesium-transporting ATPase (P-type)